MSIYEYSLLDGKGNTVNLKDYEGKVILVVNTATGCGFTPQYEPIENWYRKYHDAGLEILDIPCNQFGNQTPGTDEEVHEFCTLHYNTTFPQMKKSDVNGPDELPLYTYLKAQKGFEGFGKGVKAFAMDQMMKRIDRNYKNSPDIKWNFTKFVVDRKGTVAARFEPTQSLDDVENCIRSLL